MDRGHSSLSTAPRRGLWGCLTLAWIGFGRFAVGASWERVLSDYNVLEGGPMPFGIIVLVLSPGVAGKVRGVG